MARALLAFGLGPVFLWRGSCLRLASVFVFTFGLGPVHVAWALFMFGLGSVYDFLGLVYLDHHDHNYNFVPSEDKNQCHDEEHLSHAAKSILRSRTLRPGQDIRVLFFHNHELSFCYS